MKKIFESIIILITVNAFFYLLISFYNLSLNPTKWHQDARFLFSYISFVVTIITTAILFMKNNKE